MNSPLDQLIGTRQLHHVGILSPNERQAAAQMARLGLEEDYRGYVETWDVLCIFAKANGASAIEFVVPYSGPLKEFNKGLGGLHHVALTVDDIRETTARLAEKGVATLEAEPVKGAGPFLCNFLHPMFTRGFAVELVQVL